MKKNPYEENITKKCYICKQNVFVDQFGQGKCNHCGWHQDVDAIDFPDKVRYPNRISFNKAILLYSQGKPFIPSFEDFVGGLFFYSEMEFDYKLRKFGVCLKTDERLIEFFEGGKIDSIQTFKTKEEFMANAHIDGKLLKDIWADVKNANYMSCAQIPPSDKE